MKYWMTARGGHRERNRERIMDVIAIDLIAALAIWTAVFTVIRLGYLD